MLLQGYDIIALLLALIIYDALINSKNVLGFYKRPGDSDSDKAVQQASVPSISQKLLLLATVN